MQMHTLVFNCKGWGVITRRWGGDPEFLKRVVIKRGVGNFPQKMINSKKCMKMKESRQSFEKR